MDVPKSNGKTILVIDDDPEIGEVLELAMSMEGYVVHVAQNQDDGLRLMRLTQPSVVLLDYYGIGADPRRFVAEATMIDDATPIVLMTALTTATLRARDLGLKHVLTKPFDIETLLAMLHAVELPGETAS
jgi:DNA-binding response OmpR family regulator